MADYLIAIAGIFLLLAGWIGVQDQARRFAMRHPEFGPAKEEGGGCGTSCRCSDGQCRNKTEVTINFNDHKQPEEMR